MRSKNVSEIWETDIYSCCCVLAGTVLNLCASLTPQRGENAISVEAVYRDARPIENIRLGVAKIVEGYAANIPVYVDPTFAGAVVSFANSTGVCDENGYVMLKIKTTPTAGVHDVLVTWGERKGSIPITVASDDGLWAPEIKLMDGKLVIVFASEISGKLTTDKGSAIAVGNELYVDFSPTSDGRIVVFKLKYADLFPSYSFTFTIDYTNLP